jgi:hypothetical protein
VISLVPSVSDTKENECVAPIFIPTRTWSSSNTTCSHPAISFCLLESGFDLVFFTSLIHYKVTEDAEQTVPASFVNDQNAVGNAVESDKIHVAIPIVKEIAKVCSSNLTLAADRRVSGSSAASSGACR